MSPVATAARSDAPITPTATRVAWLDQAKGVGIVLVVVGLVVPSAASHNSCQELDSRLFWCTTFLIVPTAIMYILCVVAMLIFGLGKKKKKKAQTDSNRSALN